MRRVALASWLVVAGCAAAAPLSIAPPAYLPSAFSDATVAITTNAYGAYGGAPDALKIGDVAPDFTLPSADGSVLSSASLDGDVVLVFFRGFW